VFSQPLDNFIKARRPIRLRGQRHPQRGLALADGLTQLRQAFGLLAFGEP